MIYEFLRPFLGFKNAPLYHHISINTTNKIMFQYVFTLISIYHVSISFCCPSSKKNEEVDQNTKSDFSTISNLALVPGVVLIPLGIATKLSMTKSENVKKY